MVWSRIPYAYKYVIVSVTCVILAVVGNWLHLLGLFTFSVTDTNVQDQFGDTCYYHPGPSADFQGVEDMTQVDNFVIYFASPTRHLLASKNNMKARFPNMEWTKPAEYFASLPPAERSPKIFYTDLNTATFPDMSIHPLEVVGEGIEEKLGDFSPLGVDSYKDTTTNTTYITAVFTNRHGQNVARFKLLTTSPSSSSSSSSSIAPRLELVDVWQHEMFKSLNGLAMRSPTEFFVSNFLSQSPLEAELPAFLELITLKRFGNILHCSTIREDLPNPAESYEMTGPSVRSEAQFVIPQKSGGDDDNNTHQNKSTPLYCYPILSGMGQPNGIAYDQKLDILYLTTGFNCVVISFEYKNKAFALLQITHVPRGMDNAKIDKDTHDVYLGNNPSAVDVGKSLSDINHHSPAVVYQLKARMVTFTERQLADAQKAKMNSAQGGAQEQQQQEEEQKMKNYDDPEYQQQEQLQTPQAQQDEDPELDRVKEFWYVDATPVLVYADLKPVHKGASPTALPIPQEYTTKMDSTTNMPQTKWYITGSIYHQGVDVCRNVQQL